MRKSTFFALAILLLAPLALLRAAEVTNLRCEYRTAPLGIDMAKPRLSWELQVPGLKSQPSTERAVMQVAYRVLVASSEDLLKKDTGDLWDSGKMQSDGQNQIEYGGKNLVSRAQCFWKVRVWLDQRTVSEWSKPALWTMGLLSSTDWRGKWIKSPSLDVNEARYFRKEFAVDKPVKRASLRFACLGFADVLINDRKPDETLMLAPRFANPGYRVIYTTLDVTQSLKQGNNCLGVIVGNGYNSPPSKGWNSWQKSTGAPQLLLELEVEYTDGSTAATCTDETWTASQGRIRHNDFWIKEVHDLNQEQAGWALPAFKDPLAQWAPVSLAEAPKGKLQALRNPPVRRIESVKALSKEGNKYVFDRVYTGYPRVKVKGKAGDVVSIQGNAKVNMHGFGPVNINFKLKDSNEVILEPRFFVHTIGPEFTITGLKEPPAPEDVSIEVVHADLQQNGAFECSNSLFNELHRIGQHTHLNYILNYPMDPTREKAGWSQDIQNMFDSASYLTDTATLYEEWWQDYADVQRKDGQVSSVAPTNVGYIKTWNDPWWGGMIIYAPWRLYEFYGDTQILNRAYEPMKRYFTLLQKMADEKGGILEWAGASDWIEVGIEGWGPPKRTPMLLVSTMAYIYYADILGRSAALLGHPEDAATYKALAKKTRETFNTNYFDPATGLYAGAADSQASLIMPLALGVVPEDKKCLVLQKLEENIKDRNYHLSTGFVSNPYLLHGLTDLGRADLVGRMMNQTDWPSFKTVAKDGVFMETWRGGMAQMPSLGGPSTAWFYRAVLGIRNDPAKPGFKHIIIKPEMMPEVTWAKGHYDSIYGRIATSWKVETGKLELIITIPANTRATVYVPTTDPASVTESGKPVAKVKGVSFLRQEAGAAVYTVGAGSYRFRSALPAATGR